MHRKRLKSYIKDINRKLFGLQIISFDKLAQHVLPGSCLPNEVLKNLDSFSVGSASKKLLPKDLSFPVQGSQIHCCGLKVIHKPCFFFSLESCIVFLFIKTCLQINKLPDDMIVYEVDGETTFNPLLLHFVQKAVDSQLNTATRLQANSLPSNHLAGNTCNSFEAREVAVHMSPNKLDALGFRW